MEKTGQTAAVESLCATTVLSEHFMLYETRLNQCMLSQTLYLESHFNTRRYPVSTPFSDPEGRRFREIRLYKYNVIRQL